MITELKHKDKYKFLDYCSRFARKKDLFIIENNKKLYFDNPELALKVFKDIVRKKYLCFIYEEKDIEGLVLVIENQLKLIARNKSITCKLLRYLFWNINTDLEFIGHKYNPVIKSLKEFKFRFQKQENNDIYFCRKSYKNREYNGSNKHNSMGQTVNI